MSLFTDEGERGKTSRDREERRKRGSRWDKNPERNWDGIIERVEDQEQI